MYLNYPRIYLLTRQLWGREGDVLQSFTAVDPFTHTAHGLSVFFFSSFLIPSNGCLHGLQRPLQCMYPRN